VRDVRVKVCGRHEVVVTKHALTRTDTGIAGYFEATVGNTRVRAAGRWDDARAMPDEEVPHMGECVWVNGERVENEDETSYSIAIGEDDGLTVEDIAVSTSNQVAPARHSTDPLSAFMDGVRAERRAERD